MIDYRLFEDLISIKFNGEKKAYSYYDSESKKFWVVLPTGVAEESAGLLFLHEVAHVIRGDHLIPNIENMDMTTLNIATDIVINTILNLREVRFTDGSVYKACYHEDFAQVFPDFPDWKLGYFPIYNYLVEKDSDLQKLKEKFLTEIKPVPNEVAEEVKKLSKAIRKRLIENHPDVAKEVLKREFERAMQKIDKLLARSGAGCGDGGSEIIQVESRRIPRLERVLRQILSQSGENVYSYKPTYRGQREGILIEKSVLLPSSNILVICDVSGSYINVAKKLILPAVKHELKRNKFDLILFDDYPRFNPTVWSGGGGTRIKPVLEFLKKNRTKYDAILFVSDYDFFEDMSLQEVYRHLKKFGRVVLLEDWRSSL